MMTGLAAEMLKRIWMCGELNLQYVRGAEQSIFEIDPGSNSIRKLKGSSNRWPDTKERDLTAIDVKLLPGFFKKYHWRKHHGVYGYPADTFPSFSWIKSLEERGAWLVSLTEVKTAPTNLIREILDWGGGAGPRMKFEVGLGNACLLAQVQLVVGNIDNPTVAIKNALQIPGCGLTYASKFLRFLRPDIHASLDNRIRRALLNESLLRRIADGDDQSMIRGYVAFLELLTTLLRELEKASIKRPDCELPRGKSPTGWRVADIEMALFAWADQ